MNAKNMSIQLCRGRQAISRLQGENPLRRIKAPRKGVLFIVRQLNPHEKIPGLKPGISLKGAHDKEAIFPAC